MLNKYSLNLFIMKKLSHIKGSDRIRDTLGRKLVNCLKIVFD